MAIEDFFDHRCSIYHTQQESASPGYGLPGSPKFKYPKQPDLEEVPCHFGVRSASIQIAQQQPQNDMDSDIKLTLPAERTSGSTTKSSAAKQGSNTPQVNRETSEGIT